MSIDAEKVAPLLRNLIEQSLVVVIDDNYGLSTPIRNAVERTKGLIDKVKYKEICEKLTKAFWEGDDAAPTIEIVDATLHAAARADVLELGPYSDLLRVSTLHRLGKESYHRREWQASLSYTARALQMDSKSLPLLELQYRALVRLEQWDQALVSLEQIERKGSRNYFYLKGFYHRSRREYGPALIAFRSAEAIGEGSIALLRDYADTLHRLGHDGEALERIRLARKREPANIFILDLYIRICLRNENLQEAFKTLDELERYDVDRKFIHHRRATVLAAAGRWQDALRESELACQTGKNLFEAHASRIDITVIRLKPVQNQLVTRISGLILDAGLRN